MDSKTLADALNAVSAAAGAAAGLLPGVGSAVASVISMGARLGAAFARIGKDPVKELERIHDSDPLLKQVEEDWRKALEEKWK